MHVGLQQVCQCASAIKQGKFGSDYCKFVAFGYSAGLSADGVICPLFRLLWCLCTRKNLLKNLHGEKFAACKSWSTEVYHRQDTFLPMYNYTCATFHLYFVERLAEEGQHLSWAYCCFHLHICKLVQICGSKFAFTFASVQAPLADGCK